MTNKQEQQRKAQIKYRATHKEQERERQRLYRQAHKDELRQKNKEWREANKEHCKAYQQEYNRRYQSEHKEQLRERKRAYRQAHKEEQATRFRAWRANNKEWLRQYGKEVYAKQRAVIDYVKQSYGCCNPACKWDGSFLSCMLDFHHLEDKSYTISKARMTTNTWKEMNKCTILCANCHRQATAGTLDCSTFTKCEVTSDWKVKALC